MQTKNLMDFDRQKRSQRESMQKVSWVEDYFAALPMRTKCFIKGRKRRGRGERERVYEKRVGFGFQPLQNERSKEMRWVPYLRSVFCCAVR